MLITTLCNVPPWESVQMNFIDRECKQWSDSVLDAPWLEYEYLSDGIHFTWEAQLLFNGWLVDQLRPFPEPLIIITDSTVGHHDWKNGKWHGKASKHLLQMLLQIGKKKVTVDAICGSGYVARAEFGENFRPRIASKQAENATMVVIGGWNDEHSSNVIHAVRGALKASNTGR